MLFLVRGETLLKCLQACLCSLALLFQFAHWWPVISRDSLIRHPNFITSANYNQYDTDLPNKPSFVQVFAWAENNLLILCHDQRPFCLSGQEQTEGYFLHLTTM